MNRMRRFAVLVPLPLLAAACAGMPVIASIPPPVAAPAPVSAPPPPVIASPTQFIEGQRAEARRQDMAGMIVQARQHWRYVLALLPNDAEARAETARLDGLIQTRRDAAIAAGETALMRGRTADAQTAFLKALALDGNNAQARRRLIELDTRAALVRQDRKDARTRAMRTTGTEGPEDEAR